MVKLSNYQKCLKRKQPKTKKLTKTQFRKNQRACKSKKPKIKGGRKSHKGHKTKRGLAQDQRLKSKEPHEKAYRKSKRK